MKKNLSLFLAAAMILSLAACKLNLGDGASSSGTPSGESGGSSGGAGNNGGTGGSGKQNQGDVVKESWMDANGNIKIGGTAIAKTSEVVAVLKGTFAEIAMTDDSSWSDYLDTTADAKWKGVFIKDRKVKLGAFVMSQYTVTEQLYALVMNQTATDSKKPMANITWYDACAFCNELTKKTMSESNCVYYSDAQCTTPYSITNASSNDVVYPAYNATTKKWTKTGYRLPTEAEWEFCARGGDPKAKDANGKLIWNFAFAGVQTAREKASFNQSGYDSKLNDFGWSTEISGNQSHEVGTKTYNTLGLYDMSGNVWEWCYDFYNDDATLNDDLDADGYVINPLGDSGGAVNPSHCIRGGAYDNYAPSCSVSYRYQIIPSSKDRSLGLRVCRSIE